MRFQVTVVDRASGGRRAVPVEAPDERSAGWAVAERGMEVLTIEPAAAPRPVPMLPVANVDYCSAPAAVSARQGDSGPGMASVVVCGVTAAFSLLCFVAMMGSRDMGGFGWMFVGFFGNLIGSATGLVLAGIGLSQRGGSRHMASRGLVYNLLVGSPSLLVVLFWVISLMA